MTYSFSINLDFFGQTFVELSMAECYQKPACIFLPFSDVLLNLSPSLSLSTYLPSLFPSLSPALCPSLFPPSGLPHTLGQHPIPCFSPNIILPFTSQLPHHLLPFQVRRNNSYCFFIFPTATWNLTIPGPRNR